MRQATLTGSAVFDTPDHGAELNELLIERDNLRTTYVEMKGRLDEIKIYGSNRDNYEEELVQQGERIKAVHLIPELHAGNAECPLCSSLIRVPAEKLAQLREELSDISERITAIRTQNPRLQAYIREAEAQLEDVAARIRAHPGSVDS